ncbi:MAG: alpha/beta fold hydrolase [Gemmatimonadota bacterium]
MSVRRRTIFLGIAFGLMVVVLAGPRTRMGSFPGFPDLGPDVEAYLRASESAVPDLRPGDGKQIVWADSTARGPTDLALVYVHGFSADPHEVEPLMTNLGRSLGANVYLTRLAGHGRAAPAMGAVEVSDWLADAGEAMAVGRRLGRRVVLVGTSTGGTLATWAAGRPEFQDGLAALVLLSPNFHPKDRMSRLLLWPWGGLLARLVEGRERCFETHNEAHARHWTECYPTRALLPMMALVEHVRTSDLGRVRVPTLVVYVPDDQVVDPRATEAAYARLGSAPKALAAVDRPDDPDLHVPAGDILSPGTTVLVEERVRAFLTTALHRCGPGSGG